MTTTFHIGCAGWSIPKTFTGDFPGEGSHLQRYSARLDAVEINSSFYRAHQQMTYARWAETVPSDFRFSVKLPRSITHDARLTRSARLLDQFFAEACALERKLGCVLVQLPPSFAFDQRVVRRFLTLLRSRFVGQCVFEPRHTTWFDEKAGELFAGFNVGRVAADPAIVPTASSPGGDGMIAYYRLHGSPRKYYSNYGEPFVQNLALQLCAAAKSAKDVWCIFDNTALGFATGNALETQANINGSPRIVGINECL